MAIKLTVPPPIDIPLKPIVENIINQGMITEVDSSDIPSGALTLAKNVIVRQDKTSRRPGSSLLAPSKPNTNPVIRVAFIKTKDGAPYTLRMTPSTIHIRGANSWHSVNISPALKGGPTDRFITANILDKFIFSNNGIDKIQTINFDSSTCGPLGNAPNYRYVLGFFNRAVGLARRDANEVEVGWSVDGDATEWNPSVNQSSGSAPIIESPDDLSDFIKGGVALTNAMFILREKSIWLATKQPIETNPFYFYSAWPGIGGDCSYSIQLVKGGICWVDTRTQEVYAYQPGTQPVPIGTPNKKLIFKDINGLPDTVFSSFSSKPNEYSIYIPIDGGITRAWTYNFDSKAWTMNEFEGVTSAANVELAISSVTIDELLGSIDDLQGTIDSLSPLTSLSVPFSYGRVDGEITVEDTQIDFDASVSGAKPFTMVVRSKSFTLPELDSNIGKVYVEYQVSRTCTLTLSYSKDNGKTWIFAKSTIATVFDKPVLFVLRKPIKTRRFMWQLECDGGDVQLLSYGVFESASGQSVTGK